MEFFQRTTKIDFLRIRHITAIISILLVLLSLASLCWKGINWGLDFTGGTIVEVEYSDAANLNNIRQQLRHTAFADAIVQSFGSPRDVVIRLAPHDELDTTQLAAQMHATLAADGAQLQVRRIDTIGAQVSSELASQGALAIIIALIITMIYVGFRFETRFAVASALALAHDPILILGVFSFWQLEFDLTTLAAILAVIGYSLNDTIVVFDRVKENFIKLRRSSTLEVMNASINQTLSRTIMTSGLTLLVVIALLLFGGPTLFGFALSLFIGIVVGTYSSIYVAGALAVALGLKRADLISNKSPTVDDRP